MRIVLDTNVLVSGLLSPFGPPGDIVRLLAAGAVRACYDARILDEYLEVLSRPVFRIAEGRVESLLHQIAADGVLVTAQPLAIHLPDPDDEAFLAVALAGSARCLVTGNLRHYPKPLRRHMPVVPPRDFLDLYPESSLAGPGLMPPAPPSARSPSRSRSDDPAARSRDTAQPMGHTITVRVTPELAAWLKETSARTGVPQGAIVRKQLERARRDSDTPTFMELAGAVRGARDLSARRGFSKP